MNSSNATFHGSNDLIVFGMKVTYTGASDEQVKWSNNYDPRGMLTIGGKYTVEHVEQHSWYIQIHLAEYPGKMKLSNHNNIEFSSRSAQERNAARKEKN